MKMNNSTSIFLLISESAHGGIFPNFIPESYNAHLTQIRFSTWKKLQ